MAPEIPSRFNIAEWFLDRPAEAHPERIAILGEPRAVCYGELRELANRVGNALLAGGMRAWRSRADCVARFGGIYGGVFWGCENWGDSGSG